MSQYEYSTSCLVEQLYHSGKLVPITSVARNISPNQIMLVILGGGVTTTQKRAAGYIDLVKPVLDSAGIKDIKIYAAVYSFGSIESELIKINAFRRAGRKVIKISDDADSERRQEAKLREINTNEPIPEYILDLYDELIAPRIVASNPAQTIKNMRNIIFLTHCHGAVVLQIISDIAKQELRNAGFSDDAIANILKNIVAVQHNPVGPLESTQNTTVSFLSTSDDVLEYHNDFSKYVMKKDEIHPSFFDDKYGNIFAAGKLKKQDSAEHGFSDGYKPDSAHTLTENGQIIFAAEKNALINAIRAAQSNQPIPSPKQLTSGNGVDFDTMNKNGQQIIQSINLIQQNPAHDYQK